MVLGFLASSQKNFTNVTLMRDGTAKKPLGFSNGCLATW
jgi:hypothetical protein